MPRSAVRPSSSPRIPCPEKLEYIYRLLVHDKLITPLPEEQVSQEAIRHRLAMWVSTLGKKL